MLKSPTTRVGKDFSGKATSGDTVICDALLVQRLYKFKIRKCENDLPNRSTPNTSRATTSGLSKKAGKTVAWANRWVET